MANKVYYLSTCSTCQRIMGDLPLEGFVKQDIKTEPITEAQLQEMKTLAGSYEALFSRVAMKYKAWGLKEKNLSETDYKNYILEEYTFLKRPVFIVDNQIFIGNSKKNVAALTEQILK
ncbi:ArsC/Spx/MgsR family protein [Fulvivirgaceae bacterium BMA12]|uniref:ArsC/Spx/MgsR family protein n=1 Tax=Agaribacillus aureus TaxID=3051825 RepID=A0ABT8LG85_9BACT|nr:ArsC/Spx/MgsR family protein [Fulvivirgaceae bacterium BMA12]